MSDDIMDQLRDEYSRLQQDQPTGHVMPWGKHKGELLQDVPFAYLRWLWATKPSYRKLVAPYLPPDKRPPTR